MRTDAYIRVMCDRCEDYDEEIQLCSLAGGGYDERDVNETLKDYGWLVVGEIDTCPNCVEEDEERERELNPSEEETDGHD